MDVTQNLTDILSLGAFLKEAQTGPHDVQVRAELGEVPSHERQTRWDFAVVDDPTGPRQLRMKADNRVFVWNIPADQEFHHTAENPLPILMTRESDMEPDKFLLGGKVSQGAAQIHRSTPNDIYATIQDGRRNMTFNLRKGKGDQWYMIPKTRRPSVFQAPVNFAQKVQEAGQSLAEKKGWVPEDSLLPVAGSAIGTYAGYKHPIKQLGVAGSSLAGGAIGTLTGVGANGVVKYLMNKRRRAKIGIPL